MTSPDVTWPRRTERLTLRPARPDDLGRMLEFRSLDEVGRWLIRATVDPEAYRRGWLASVDDPYDHSVVVELEGRVIGTVLLEVVDGMGQDDGTPAQRSEGLLGYIFDPGHAGQGFATEAAREMVALAFEDLGLRRVTAGCFADNMASWTILEKLGMRREQHGIRDSWHADLGWLDGFTYGLLSDEWRQLSNA
ncbi:GNAT family N-acetyltransferase [Pedococcus bigeumensis]|uniref:N-acetyltransferase n=1 Tax=Pedococcus bigeumensis TaxID=433644 RepID=A0A502CZH2_9MICO|nr:GNAT family protein [Pedococcus bigeumensis]TPG17920.1 N-acetyltransferase [Pedococcus bigeumensis]